MNNDEKGACEVRPNIVPAMLNKTFDFMENYVKNGNTWKYPQLARMVDCIAEETSETTSALHKFGNTKPGSNPLAESEELLDGFLDTAFTALGSAYVQLRFMGHSPERAAEIVNEGYHRVCDANLTKKDADGNVIRDGTGKVCKPPGFKPPHYEDIIFPEPVILAESTEDDDDRTGEEAV